MGKLLAAAATTLALVTTTTVLCAPALAEPAIEPVSAASVPDGPAPAWIVADMETGQVLAGREM